MVKLPVTTHPAYTIAELAFAYIMDADSRIVVRVQADSEEETNEIASFICDCFNSQNVTATGKATKIGQA